MKVTIRKGIVLLLNLALVAEIVCVCNVQAEVNDYENRRNVAGMCDLIYNDAIYFPAKQQVFNPFPWQPSPFVILPELKRRDIYHPDSSNTLQLYRQFIYHFENQSCTEYKIISDTVTDSVLTTWFSFYHDKDLIDSIYCIFQLGRSREYRRFNDSRQIVYFMDSKGSSMGPFSKSTSHTYEYHYNFSDMVDSLFYKRYSGGSVPTVASYTINNSLSGQIEQISGMISFTTYIKGQNSSRSTCWEKIGYTYNDAGKNICMDYELVDTTTDTTVLKARTVSIYSGPNLIHEELYLWNAQQKTLELSRHVKYEYNEQNAVSILYYTTNISTDTPIIDEHLYRYDEQNRLLEYTVNCGTNSFNESRKELFFYENSNPIMSPFIMKKAAFSVLNACLHNNIFSLTLSTPCPMNFKASIVDTRGRTVNTLWHNQRINAGVTKTKTTLDHHHRLATGVYHVVISLDNMVISKPVLFISK